MPLPFETGHTELVLFNRGDTILVAFRPHKDQRNEFGSAQQVVLVAIRSMPNLRLVQPGTQVTGTAKFLDRGIPPGQKSTQP
jgi:hypothetical protein